MFGEEFKSQNKIKWFVFKAFWFCLVIGYTSVLITGCSKKVLREEIIVEKVIYKDKIIRDTVEFERVVIKEIQKEVKIWEPHNIQFEFDNYQLSHNSIMVLGDIAEEMRTNPNMKIIIGGHTCPIGTYEYNLSLSEARANAAKNYLMTIGISDERIETMSYGEERLLNDNPANYWVNRRDTFFLVRK